MRRSIEGLVVALVLAGLAGTASAQQFEADRRTRDADALGYLKDQIDYRLFLPPPPAKGSADEALDRARSLELQQASDVRWRSAEADSEFLYPRFDEAFGRPIRRERYPALIRLLNRSMRDVKLPMDAAKAVFRRPRPFQDRQLPRLCQQAAAPAPNPGVTDGTSYPSGHTAYGWAVAMVLARVDPERSAALMTRAEEYAESRVVCGYHYPSDTQAGRALATATVARLDADPGFAIDLAAARAEIAAAARPPSP